MIYTISAVSLWDIVQPRRMSSFPGPGMAGRPAHLSFDLCATKSRAPRAGGILPKIPMISVMPMMMNHDLRYALHGYTSHTTPGHSHRGGL